MVKKSVEIEERHQEFLDDTDSFNLSGAVRERIEAEIERRGWSADE